MTFADPRRWRLISSVALDASSFLELVSPLAPTLFIPIAAAANVGKNISWLAASASRAAIHNSFAKCDNLADVTAKAGSQSIAASLVGTSLGVALSAQLGGAWGPTTLATFAGLSAAHLGCTWWSLNYVRLETLNSQRLDLLLATFLDRRSHNSSGARLNDEAGAPTGDDRAAEDKATGKASSTAAASGWLPSPADVAALESFVPAWPLRGRFEGPGLGDWLLLAPPLPALAQTPDELRAFRAALRPRDNGSSRSSSSRYDDRSGCSHGGYVLSVRTRRSAAGTEEALLALALDASAASDAAGYSEAAATLRGVLHAVVLRRALEAQGTVVSAPGTGGAAEAANQFSLARQDAFQWAARPDMVQRTALAAQGAWADLEAALEASEWKAEVLHVDNSLAARAIGPAAVF